MKIALDYDETFTADKELWTAFVRAARARGHSVTFVTFRFENLDRYGGNSDIMGDAAMLGIDVVFSGGRQKSHCFEADIWVDDKPVFIPSADAMRSMLVGCEVMGDTMEHAP